MMSNFCIWFVLFLYGVSDTRGNKLTVYSMSSIHYGQARGQQLAAEQINTDDTLLPDHEIEVIPVFNDTHYYRRPWKQAVYAAMDTVAIMMDPPSDNSSLIVPIVLGPSNSDEVTATAHIFYANRFGTLSDSASSVALSSPYLYPYFYRVIPDDTWQCRAIVELCKHFGWDSIAVLYVNYDWAMYMANGILELSSSNQIKAHSIPFDEAMLSFYHHMHHDEEQNATNHTSNASPFHETATFLKSLETYIIILIAYDPEIFAALMFEGLWGYPYYYIGMESWLDPSEIKWWMYDHKYRPNSSQVRALEGYIGVAPWRPYSLSERDYEDPDLRIAHDKALLDQKLLISLWDDNQRLWSVAFNGWDSMYALAHALDIYDKRYSIDDNYMDNYVSFFLLDRIIREEVQFLGATGNVTFDSFGNRKNVVYNYVNVLGNGTVLYLGHFSNNDIKLNSEEDIVWPSYFRERGMIPRSRKLVRYEIITVDPILFAVICILVSISAVFVLLLIAVTIYFRAEPLLVAGSWRLNLFVCAGSLLAYVHVILEGMDESHVDLDRSQRNVSLWSGLCNTRLWLLSIAFSVLFMPLFMKTYRLARIFNSMDIQTVQDYKLMIAVVVCVLIDSVLLTIFMVIDPLHREYRTGSTVIIDVLQETQYEFGVCTRHNLSLLYYMMGLWKLLQLCFGVYVAVIVSRIGLSQLIKFDETGQQIFAITFTVFTTTIIVTYAVVSNNSDRINEKYAVKSLGVLIVCNVSLIVNTCVRLHATYYAKMRNDVTKLKQFEETFESTMLKQIEIQMLNIQNRKKTIMATAHHDNKETKHLELPNSTNATKPPILHVPSNSLDGE